MKLTKAQIKAFEDEDRDIIAQTEADFDSGRLVEIPLTGARRRAISEAAREALEWSRSLKEKGLPVTVHVKRQESAVKKPKPGSSRKPAR